MKAALPVLFKILVLSALLLGTSGYSQITINSDGTWKGVGNNAAAGGTAWLFPGYNDAAWPLVQAPNPGNVIPVVPGSLSMWSVPYSDTAKMRKTFVVPVGDSYAGTISINADNEFTLYFNGVSQGFFNWWPSGPYNFNIAPALQGCVQNVIAVNAVNWGGPYGASLSTTINVVNPLTTPIATPATNIGCNEFTANWGAIATADFYLLDVSTDSNFLSFYSVYNGFNVGNVTSFNLTGLPLPGPYYYRLRAQRTNALGTLQTCYSNVITVNFITAPIINAGADPTICPGSSTNLNGSGMGVVNWNPALGIAPTNVLNPVVNPVATTTYTLTITNAGCVSTDDVTVFVSTLPTLNLNNDTTVCPGSCVNLNVSGGDYFVWSPYPGMVDSSLTTQTVCPAASTTYTVTAYTAGSNIIDNGDFSAGNTGFSSSYNYSFPNTTEGEYYVGNNPSAWNGGLSPCADHTTGAGNMLMVNGSPVANVSIWCQTVTVSPNTDYLFSTWITPAYAVNMPILQFSINGVVVGSPFSPSGANCTWEEFFTTWNSGVSTTANICIVNQNTNIAGNDFAIDDISFAPVCSQVGTVDVNISTLPAPTANNTGPYCVGQTIQLNSPTGSATDDWVGPLAFVANDIQNPSIPLSTMAMSGVYTVTVANAIGCTSTATTNVVVNAAATPVANNSGPFCIGSTINLSSPAGPISWDWTGPNAFVQNATQNPNILSSTLAMAGIYTVTVTMPGGCTGTGTTNVVVNALPIPTANNTGPYCSGATIQLNSPTGSATDDWTGPGYVQNDLQNPTINNSTVGMSGTYTVTVTDLNGCSATATTNVTVNALPVVVAGNNTPTCEFQNVNFNSAGGVDFDWTGPGGYNQPNTQNPTIVAAPIAASGDYTVTVTDANGCISTGTTTVVINANLVFVAASNSPICEGSQLDLTAQNIAGASYDWTGPNAYNVLNTQNPSIAGATVAAAGTYTVTATNGAGCTGTATVNVVINSIPTPLFIGDNLQGCATVCVNFTDQSAVLGSVITSWSWNVESQAASNSQNVNYCFNTPGLYDAALTVTSAAGCSATLTMTDYISVIPAPIADFAYSPQLIVITNPDVSFGNLSFAATNYSWNLGDGTISNATNVQHSYADTGIYCVTLLASNPLGCADTMTHCLNIKPVFTVFIPNSFTPNDDENNPIFYIYGNGVKTVQAYIFNRWGQEIYSFSNMNDGWNGTTRDGLNCPIGTYVYRVEVVDIFNNPHQYMGMVNLIR